MKINRKNAIIIKNAILEWKNESTIDEATYHKLLNSIEIMTFDWKKASKYSFWVAIICIVTMIGSILGDRILMDLISKIFDTSDAVKFSFLSLITIVLFWLGYKRGIKTPSKKFSNEAILFFGVLSTAGALAQLGKMLDTGSGHFSILILLSFIIYGVIGFYFKSNLVWLFALTSFGTWLGTETGYMSGWGAYYLGMNYPMRFVLLGIILTSAALYIESIKKFEHIFRTTLIMGLLYLFISLWLMSIFGNYGDIDRWYEVKQIELFHWSFIFGLASALSITHGLKFDNGVTKGFGVTFLFINLYTRYFEFFWDHSHKAIFFGIMGISFWILGSKAEKIWNLEFIKKRN